jgi:hypothetical protein
MFDWEMVLVRFSCDALRYEVKVPLPFNLLDVRNQGSSGAGSRHRTSA